MTLSWFLAGFVVLILISSTVNTVLLVPYSAKNVITFFANYISVDMCVQPIVVTYSERLNKSSESGIKVYGRKHSVLCTCGKCVECVKQYQNDWMTRIYSEMRRQHKAVFFTLTYRDDSIPQVANPETGELCNTVRKEDVSKWLKCIRELRRKRGLSVGFRWFLTSEYGPATLRPHYHGLVLGLSLREMMPFLAKWQKLYGFTTQRELSLLDTKSCLCTIRYTAKYCAKGEYENPLVDAGIVEPTFHLISKSIGDNFLTDNKRDYFLAMDFVDKRDACGEYTRAYLEEIAKRLNYTIPPYSYHLARYYREKVFSKRKDLQTAYSDYVCERVLEQRSPTLVRISTEKPYPVADKALREAIRSDYSQTILSEKQRASDARGSITKFFKSSKL